VDGPLQHSRTEEVMELHQRTASVPQSTTSVNSVPSPLLPKFGIIAASREAAEGASSYQPQVQMYFKVTVFQAAPLAFKLACGGWRPLPRQDFTRERTIFKEVLNDAAKSGVRIDLEFETATTERLNQAFSSEDRHMIHISCHGHPEYLAIENGWGELQPLCPQDIKEMVARSPRGDAVQAVFVSCSHSRSMGQAFVDAGIRHVICCHQGHQFKEVVAHHFTKTLYQYLSSGETLKLAFAMAQASILDSPDGCLKEMQKYILLPERPDSDPYHDVPVLLAKKPQLGRLLSTPTRAKERAFPRLPPYFTARQLDMFRVIKGLKSSNFVKISGSEGTGKATLAAAVGRYIQERSTGFIFHDMLWLPSLDRYFEDDEVSTRLRDIFDVLKASWADADVCDDLSSLSNRYAQSFRRLLGHFDGRQMLLIINGRDFNTKMLAVRLGRFLSDMLHLTNAKIVLASPRGVRVKVRHSGKEELVILGPLNFQSSASLFGQISQHVSGRKHHDISTPEQFVNLLVRAYHADETTKEGISKNASLFEAIGAGNPGLTVDKARWMPSADYDNLINSVTESADGSKKTESSRDGSRDTIMSRGESVSQNSSSDVIMQPAPFARAGSPGNMDFESGETKFESTGTDGRGLCTES
jgi:energy-coupling factor transporter ATP-binding protein EcfA2